MSHVINFHCFIVVLFQKKNKTKKQTKPKVRKLWENDRDYREIKRA